MSLIHLTIDEVMRQLNECEVAKRALTAEVIELRRQLRLKEKLLEELGKQLQEALLHKSDWEWHKSWSGVSFKRCPTPERQILEKLREKYYSEPHTAQGDFRAPVKQLADEVGMSKNTLRSYMNSLDGKGLILCRHEGQGQEEFFVTINERLLASASVVNRIVPLERKENRGGLRGKKTDEETECSNCGSPRVEGHRHVSLICKDCGHVFDEWREFPAEPPREEEFAAPAPGRGEDDQAPVMKVQEHFTIAPAPGLVPLPLPDAPCRKCGRPRHVCMQPVGPEAPGIWWHTCE